MRMESQWPPTVRKAMLFGLALFKVLSEAVLGVQIMDLARRDKLDPVIMESHLLSHLQGLMDRVFEAQEELDRSALEALAGIGGCDVIALRRFWASSGIEAANQVAWCVRRAVVGEMDNPFSLLMPTATTRRKLKQVGREAPHASADLAEDDRAILRAVVSGADYTGGVAGAIGMSVSHVGKRKMDLKKWGLVREHRSWRMTKKGETWESDLRGPTVGDETG